MEATIQDTKPFYSKEHFQLYRAAFKKLAHQKQLTAMDMIIYNILRGREPNYGFGEITNPIKIANGNKSKFFNIRWQLWNYFRTYTLYKKSNPAWATTSLLSAIGHYDNHGKIFTDQILEHIYNVLQK